MTKQIHNLLNYKDLKIVQDTELFNFSLDSVLLANFVTINTKVKNILDIGTGNAPIPILLTTRTNSKITAIEIQKQSYDLAKESIEMNKLSEKIDLILGDINDYYKNLESDVYDVITCNPPFFKTSDNSRLNNEVGKTIARHEKTLDLDSIFKVSKKLLKNNGRIAIVHRVDRLVDIICTMRKYNIEPKKIRLVYPKVGKEANILLIEGTKNGQTGLKFMPPLYAHNEDGSYTEEVKKYFG